MNLFLNRTDLARYFDWAVNLFVVKTGATCLVMAFILTIGGGLQPYTQSMVTMMAHHAWLGTAPEGHIRVYSCIDDRAIDRLTIVGNTNPCPDSQVSIASIEEASSASTQYFQQTLLIFYFMCLLLTTIWVGLTSKALSAYTSALLHRFKQASSREKLCKHRFEH